VSDLRIGFIGLGNMGGRMTKAIVRSGHSVIGYDPVAERITEAGAEPAASAGEVTSRADVVLLSLPESKIVERVMFGEDGVFEHVHAGQVVVDLSTSSPDSTRAIAQRLTEKDVDYIDAGISGGAAAADKAALTLMVGGDQAALERVRPVLDLFSAEIHYMGASGNGHVTKLLNNFLNATNLTTTAEVMVAGKKAGLDLAALLEVINHSSGVNFASLNRFPRIITGDYLEGGLTSDLMLKDVLLYVEYAASLGVASVNASAPLAAFGLAERLGYGQVISNRVVDAIGDVSGGVRLHESESDEEGKR
jgi:3-hydroxyisobutyrate dehydrogenase-like beta-hydroxyacid dehydrogenase